MMKKLIKIILSKLPNHQSLFLLSLLINSIKSHIKMKSPKLNSPTLLMIIMKDQIQNIRTIMVMENFLSFPKFKLMKEYPLPEL